MHNFASLQSGLQSSIHSNLSTNDNFTSHTTWANSNTPMQTLTGYPATNHVTHLSDVTKSSIHYNPHLSTGEKTKFNILLERTCLYFRIKQQHT